MSIFPFINVSEDIPFLALSASFLLVAPTSFPEKFSLFMGIVAMWLFLCVNKKKVADMLIAHDSKLTNDLTAHDSKIANEINTEIRENSASFTKELTAVIENFNARNNSFSLEANGFLASLNTITNKLSEAEKTLELHHNNFCGISSEFTSIKASIEILQNDLAQRYAVVRRADFDQQSVSNESETNEPELESSLDSASASTSSNSSSEGSNLSGILDIISDIKIRFKQHFDRLMKARNYTFDEMCFLVAVDIRSLGGNIKISTVKSFYNGVSGSKVSTVNQINVWVANFR